jgi:hypothetical protein
MAIWMAAALAAAAWTGGDDDALPRSLQLEDEISATNGIVAARLGAWAGRSFRFEAIRPDGTKAASTQQAFFSASLLGGVQFYDHLVLLGTVESDVASKITINAGGVYVGWRERPKQRYGKGVPDEVMAYAGVLVGRVKVDETDFGTFDRSVGFGGGFTFGWTLSPHCIVQFYAEYRNLSFDYNRSVLSGDDKIGGSSVWLGAGIDYRF